MMSGSIEVSGNTARVLAPAKVNLFIEILGKRPDGYHDILTVMQAISLYDVVTVTRRGTGVEVICRGGGVPSGPDNIAYRDSLGWVFYRLGRFGEAMAELEKAAAGDDPDAVILDHLGDAYLKANQVEKAKNAWERAVKAFRKAGQTKDAQKVESKLKARPK